MKLSTKILCLLGLLLSMEVGATPAGLATVMSIYRNRETSKPVLVRGYGIVVEINLVLPGGRIERQYVIQTVSHLSQGGLDPGSRSSQIPENEIRKTPRLLIDLAVDQGNNRVFGHFMTQKFDPAFQEITKGKDVLPLIGSSYFESFRDRDLLILAPGSLPARQIPAAVSLTYFANGAPPQIRFPPLRLEEDWRMSRLAGGLTIPCPKSYPACREESALLSGASDLKTELAQRLSSSGFVKATYDAWIPVSTNPGMSGLPVFKSDTSGKVASVVGLVSGSSPQSFDTWLSEFDPVGLFRNYSSSPKSFMGSEDLSSAENFIWVMENYALARVGQNENFALQESGFEASLGKNEEGNPLRCSHGSELRLDHGSGFRIDNGSGFRVDNGDLVCGGGFHRGQDFQTQIRGGSPSQTAFMVMNSLNATMIYPPTASGFGAFFKENQNSKPGDPNFKILSLDSQGQASLLLTEIEFSQFAQKIFKKLGSIWTADLEIAEVNKTDASKMSVSESQGKVQLSPRFVEGKLRAVILRISGPRVGVIEREISYDNLRGQNSITLLLQKVQWAGGNGLLNLAGLLMQNPDSVATEDPRMKTLFVMSAGKTIFYFTVKAESH